MPRVGLGTWLTVGQACYDLVTNGLKAGLRHIDTSENYANHEVKHARWAYPKAKSRTNAHSSSQYHPHKRCYRESDQQ